MSDLVLTERHESVAILTLNRPERHNSLVPELLEELFGALRGVADDEGVRAVVLQANGRSFSTGGDVRAFYERGEQVAEYAERTVGLLNWVILSLLRLPQPVVAAVHGLVTGGSLGLVLGCDLVLVAPHASFTPYYSVVAFSPDGGWTAILPAIIGRSRAAEVLMRNATITAEEAVAWGLAARVVPAQQIRAEALRVAKEIAGKKAGSLARTKALLGPAYADVAARLEDERLHFVRQIVTGEAQQGMAAFLEGMKRCEE